VQKIDGEDHPILNPKIVSFNAKLASGSQFPLNSKIRVNDIEDNKAISLKSNKGSIIGSFFAGSQFSVSATPDNSVSGDRFIMWNINQGGFKDFRNPETDVTIGDRDTTLEVLFHNFFEFELGLEDSKSWVKNTLYAFKSKSAGKNTIHHLELRDNNLQSFDFSYHPSSFPDSFYVYVDGTNVFSAEKSTTSTSSTYGNGGKGTDKNVVNLTSWGSIGSLDYDNPPKLEISFDNNTDKKIDIIGTFTYESNSTEESKTVEANTTATENFILENTHNIQEENIKFSLKIEEDEENETLLEESFTFEFVDEIPEGNNEGDDFYWNKDYQWKYNLTLNEEDGVNSLILDETEKLSSEITYIENPPKSPIAYVLEGGELVKADDGYQANSGSALWDGGWKYEGIMLEETSQWITVVINGDPDRSGTVWQYGIEFQ